MPVEIVDTLVIGAGQAGIAMSEHLGKCGIPHLVLERHRVAERWRSERWDSLVTNGPAWHDRFPGMEYPGAHPDDFVPKEKVADYFVAYAEMIAAPIRCGVEVQRVRRLAGRPGFCAQTSHGMIEARSVVVATGAFQSPVVPDLVPQEAGVLQIHSNAYRNPAQLPDGAVLIVGAGSSGGQIADELLRAGRRVYLSVGAHGRPPRAYRQRDYCWWLGVLGKWEVPAPTPGTQHVTISVSGANGGHTVEFRRYASRGMILLGTTRSCKEGTVNFGPDLAENLKQGDANYMSALDEADAYVVRNGLDLPEEPEARRIDPDPPCVTDPILALNLRDAGVASIIWATGYSFDYGWLDVDVLDEGGKPKHQRGVSAESGLYFLGLPWQSRRGSSFIWGVWHDARYLADQISIQRAYQAYNEQAGRRVR
jgi:putative flavoprotein involved in K+ transport